MTTARTRSPATPGTVAGADPSLRWLRRLAWLCAALVLAITSLSASLRLAKAGIGCAPWPACYGVAQQALLAPAAADQAAQAPASATLDTVRSAHRVLAVATLFLILVMGAVCRHARRERGQWWALLAVTLFLAGLGPWSARSALPAVALGNLLGGFAMLVLSVRLAAPRRWAVTPSLRAWLWVAAVALLAQIVLGGLASTTGSILSCDGLADCWHAAQGRGWAVLDPWRLPGSGGRILPRCQRRIGRWPPGTRPVPACRSMPHRLPQRSPLAPPPGLSRHREIPGATFARRAPAVAVRRSLPAAWAAIAARP